MGRQPVLAIDRFWKKVLKDANNKGCWLWTGSKTPGGALVLSRSKLEGGGLVSARRLSLEFAYGKMIPAYVHIRSICDEQRCVRPDHLQVMSEGQCLEERGLVLAATNAAKTHCPKGHPFDETNTYLYRSRRYCRTCKGLKPAKQA